MEPATIEAAARHLIPLDFDNIPCPESLDPFFEPDETVDYVVTHYLPSEFHGAAFWWQFTSSHGIKPGINIRLFFWSDRPLEDWELKIWLADYPVDLAIYSPAQQIYVANPIFVGMPDPVPFRSGLWQGDRDEVTPPLIERQKPHRAGSATPDSGSAGGGGYEHYCAQIGDHDGGAGFFGPIKSAVAAWIGLNGAAADTGVLRKDLERSIRDAPRDTSKHSDDYIEVRVADLNALIAAIVRYQAAKEAVWHRCEPTYPAPIGSVVAARAALHAVFSQILADTLAYQIGSAQLAA